MLWTNNSVDQSIRTLNCRYRHGIWCNVDSKHHTREETENAIGDSDRYHACVRYSTLEIKPYYWLFESPILFMRAQHSASKRIKSLCGRKDNTTLVFNIQKEKLSVKHEYEMGRALFFQSILLLASRRRDGLVFSPFSKHRQQILNASWRVWCVAYC